ncbi:MAG: shikimate dehydrogenase [Actinomycetota bacterium]|jgi:shikimate dehydrogenase|nr:shikimate dehydrogenase [Rubrobacter sp.]MDQ3507211.1 shikimate dehydrogenase [Actinomycetota bacterium]
MITGKTKLLGLMGRPVSHSLSPAMHNAAFSEENLDFVYVAMDVDPDKLPDAVRGAAALGFRGFNLTMPHKEKIIPLLDEMDGAAKISGAVNTVVIESGKLRGHNTDGSGMAEACREAGAKVSGKTIVLLGAGGAASAISFALQSEGASSLHIFNRSVDRAESLAAKLEESGEGTEVRAHPLESLETSGISPDILINTTSLGMKNDDPLPVPAAYLESLPEHATVADAVYLPGDRTSLLHAAGKLGLRTINGQRMLLYQGVHAQKLWTGLEPNVEAMDAELPGVGSGKL